MQNRHETTQEEGRRFGGLRGDAVDCRYVLASVLLYVLSGQTLWAEQPAPRRARPPVWSQDVRALFFDDARLALEGERPDYAALAGRRGPTSAVSGAANALPDSAVDMGWADLVTAETIETEIKRVAQQVAADVTTPAAFKGGGYQKCRGHFSMLAVLFAVAAEHDGNVRWHDAAPGLRNLFSRAGYNTKTGTDQTYREATQRNQDLADLVRGSRPTTPAAERVANWYEVADRPMLMQRIEQAHEQRLSKWLASSNEFKRNSEEVQHEAQLLAMLAEVIQKEGFDYWDDDSFRDLARELRNAASELSRFALEGNFDAARAAQSHATKACSNCHENYRG
jgi:hypothetical protein